jgi:hypothetical protein
MPSAGKTGGTGTSEIPVSGHIPDMPKSTHDPTRTSVNFTAQRDQARGVANAVFGLASSILAVAEKYRL